MISLALLKSRRHLRAGAIMSSPIVLIVPLLLVLLSFIPQNAAFTVSPISTSHYAGGVNRRNPGIGMPTGSQLYALPDIGEMKLGDMRKELESYGISTKVFLEKKEFQEALLKARAEGKVPINNNHQKDPQTTTTTTTSEPNGAPKSGASREERIQMEMEKAKSMKVGDLKKKLKDMGISTKSFFEKSEFVKAYGEAVVDGVKNKAGGSRTVQEEDFDPTYRDVVMQKFDTMSQQRLLQGTVIDIKLK